MKRDSITYTGADGTLQTAPVEWHFNCRDQKPQNTAISRPVPRRSEKRPARDQSIGDVMAEIREGLKP